MRKKYKRLTRAEKSINKEIRAELRADGILPPVKPKLNRKKFVAETIKEFKENSGHFDDIRYLYEAIGWMLPSTEIKTRIKITPEQIGVAKLLKIAVELKSFYQKKIDDGETKYKPSELYEDVIDPILKL